MELTLGKARYRTGRLNAFQQLHVSRRLAPIFMAQVTGLREAMKDPETVESLKKSTGESPHEMVIAQSLGPVMTAISKMADADVDFILTTCLSVVERDVGSGTWAKVLAPTGQLMYEDITMVDLIQIAAAVVRENCADFMDAEGKDSQAGGLSAWFSLAWLRKGKIG